MCECSRIRRCASGSGSWKKRHLQTRHSYCDIAYGRRTKQLGQPGFVAEREEREIGAHVFRERRAGVDSRRSKRRERGKGCRWTRRMVCARNVASLRPTRVYVISRVGYTRTDRQLRQHLYAGGGGNCPPAAAQNLAVAREAPLAAGWSQGASRRVRAGRTVPFGVADDQLVYRRGKSVFAGRAPTAPGVAWRQPTGRTDGRPPLAPPPRRSAPSIVCSHTRTILVRRCGSRLLAGADHFKHSRQAVARIPWAWLPAIFEDSTQQAGGRLWPPTSHREGG